MEAPYMVKIEFLHTGLADAVEILPFVKRTGPLTISFITSDALECYQLIRSSIMIAGSVS
jgi:D-amino peptidase